MILLVRELEGSLLLHGTNFNATTPIQYENTFERFMTGCIENGMKGEEGKLTLINSNAAISN